jgi:hypothetical protein
VIETGSGALIGIESRLALPRMLVTSRDSESWRRPAAITSNWGVVLYDGGRPVPFGDRLVAAPMSCLWA